MSLNVLFLPKLRIWGSVDAESIDVYRDQPIKSIDISKFTLINESIHLQINHLIWNKRYDRLPNHLLENCFFTNLLIKISGIIVSPKKSFGLVSMRRLRNGGHPTKYISTASDAACDFSDRLDLCNLPITLIAQSWLILLYYSYFYTFI